MTKECIHTSKPTTFDGVVLAIWFVPALLLIVGAVMSYGSLPYVPWICVAFAALILITFVAWVPKEYVISEDRIHIRCILMSKDFHFKDIESIRRDLPLRELISAALIDKGVYMTSFKNALYVKLKGKLTRSTQMSPVDHDMFLEILQKCLNDYENKEA
jgi:hypothetical protein